MLRIRIVATTASVLAFLLVTLGSAAAQNATAGAPLSLLQFLQQKWVPKPAAKLARKTTAKHRIARRTIARTQRTLAQAPRTPAATATAAPPKNIWPGTDAAAPDNAALANVAPDNPAPGNTAPDSTQTPDLQSASPAMTTEKVLDTYPNNEIVTDGHTVKLTSPEGLNPVDVAGDDRDGPAKTAPAAPPASDPAVPEPVVHAMVANATAQDPPSPVGSASWIAHVLAALGGAITAGVLAWFLIGHTPERNYG
jgi:hypothetical protein